MADVVVGDLMVRADGEAVTNDARTGVVTVKPYMDPTTGEWVGEHETPLPEGDVSRRTEWFATEQEAWHFARRGTNHRHSHLRPAAGRRVPVPPAG